MRRKRKKQGQKEKLWYCIVHVQLFALKEPEIAITDFKHSHCVSL